MLTSPDFRELLKIFEKHKIRYLVVGRLAGRTAVYKLTW